MPFLKGLCDSPLQCLTLPTSHLAAPSVSPTHVWKFLKELLSLCYKVFCRLQSSCCVCRVLHVVKAKARGPPWRSPTTATAHGVHGANAKVCAVGAVHRCSLSCPSSGASRAGQYGLLSNSALLGLLAIMPRTSRFSQFVPLRVFSPLSMRFQMQLDRQDRNRCHGKRSASSAIFG